MTMRAIDEYQGMNYEQASREAELVLRKRGWFIGFDRLQVLRDIMLREIAMNATPGETVGGDRK